MVQSKHSSIIFGMMNADLEVSSYYSVDDSSAALAFQPAAIPVMTPASGKSDLETALSSRIKDLPQKLNLKVWAINLSFLNNGVDN